MSSNNVTSNVVSVDEQAFEKTADPVVDEDGVEVVDDTPAFQATVEMEIQAKVDANHPDGIANTCDGRMHGVSLQHEEQIRAQEAELELISAQAELGGQDDRAERTREVVVKQCGRDEPDTVDPRARLSQDDLAAVNRQAMRISERIDGGWSRAVIAKRLAEKVEDGMEVTTAVLETLEEVKAESGTIVPIADIAEVPVGEVTVEGEVVELWTPSSSNIQQVGLLEDESGRTKFTIWQRSNQTMVREGQTVRFRAAAKSWYQGRCSLALTGWSRIEFPERGRWWDE
ncbi:DNA-binding protein [Halostagnicola kamekurae]|uniref:SsDNA-binding replication factor A, large subunit n=1 Tax=Halostagnicola kamekurae TaxID=619731 RepID=A0A1I6V6D5_9EURY|nr:DNA-binding protein [Halostagnicola kamekurae]SFT09184.1 hypothetical protein SAMN04488556_0084 [Halostagnicola kamekurae]